MADCPPVSGVECLALDGGVALCAVPGCVPGATGCSGSQTVCTAVGADAGACVLNCRQERTGHPVCGRGAQCSLLPETQAGCLPMGLAECGPDAGCAAGAHCVPFLESETGHCAPDCASTEDCAPSGQSCFHDLSGNYCSPAGLGGTDAPCLVDSECLETHECTGAPGLGRCQPRCASDADCVPGDGCLFIGADVGTCGRKCEPFANDPCPMVEPGRPFRCLFANDQPDAGGICVDTYQAEVPTGAPCTSYFDCGPKQLCVRFSPTHTECRPYCQTNAHCPGATTCELLDNRDVGICVE